MWLPVKIKCKIQGISAIIATEKQNTKFPAIIRKPRIPRLYSVTGYIRRTKPLRIHTGQIPSALIERMIPTKLNQLFYIGK